MPPPIALSGRLCPAAQSLFLRLADGEATGPADAGYAAQDLVRCILSYDGRQAPLACEISDDGVTLSLLALEALSRHRDELITVVTRRLRSKYARALMMSLSAIGRTGMIEPSLAEMRRLIGADEGLRTSSHLWTRAIIPAVVELGAAGIVIHVTDIRDRRARGGVSAYRIIWSS
ncbi:MAG: hypothetical protein CTY25_12090 [Methylobacterium sp.]|nr:MAG: hypothetical protein CTY25_12090 [Methylobacterium sp.]